jgi:hypothetical protein
MTALIHDGFWSCVYSYFVERLEYAFHFPLGWKASEDWPESSAWLRSFGGRFVVEYDLARPESHRFVVPSQDHFPYEEVRFMGAYPCPFVDPVEMWRLIDTTQFAEIRGFLDLDIPKVGRVLDLVLDESVYVLAACLAYSHGRDAELCSRVVPHIEEVRSHPAARARERLGPLLWLLATVYRRGLAEAPPKHVRYLRKHAVALCRAQKTEALRKINSATLERYRRPESRCYTVDHRTPHAPVEDGAQYRSPCGLHALVEYDGEGLGWGYFLQDEEAGRFWFREVDGPEHGVSIYGPFHGDVRALFSGLRRIRRT